MKSLFSFFLIFLALSLLAATHYSSVAPTINLSRNKLNFGAVISGAVTNSETFTITNTGGGTLNWIITDNAAWLECSPASGQNSGIITVTVDPTGFPEGTHSARIAVSDLGATNSPQYIDAILNVYTPGSAKAPFGTYETPIHGSKVRSSIAVTGWVMDDIEVVSVKIYNGSTYVGDAVFVEGARPDVEQAFPDYPRNYQAGWGYMMLTNFLPNGGNGVYTINAFARDKEGHQTILGSKTITVDNANAVKPFGAIDTPTQGGTSSGDRFINWGWALTPQPNSIPTNGSTIKVWVDGVNIGNPTYNLYRGDIASLFPGYANSNGAAGYFYLDTTGYANGVHTIQWTAQDNAGNIDGIGSRYFTIQNSGGASGQQSLVTGHWSLENKELSEIPINYFEPIRVKKAYNRNSEPQEIYPDDSGVLNIQIRELERVEIHLDRTAWRRAQSAELNVETNLETGTLEQNWIGFQVIGNQLRALPVGATLDIERGIFYWQPGVGFVGDYEFVFVSTEEINRRKARTRVKILPKFGIKNPNDGY
jgi:hypothetical protein